MKTQIDPIDEHAAVLRLTGRLDLASATTLRSTVEACVADGRTRLVVDLSEVTFVDSSGLGALISGLKAARMADGDLRITGAGAQMLEILSLTNLDRVLHVYADVDTAAAWN